ncbi:hypothetical protein [Shinella sp.]|uniref:hypothetical protein n=1 Tax=Shinella sp. TaxID=1870904 RepID=UPI0029AF5B4B|nr:hypothetical protein [Shinella sp.]MDX3977081.1 hypothetical protein [Shinella sp.]
MSKSMPAALPIAAPETFAPRTGMTWRVLAFYSAITIALLLALSLPLATDYVGSDNDDAMRLVMVRDLLAGQGWFDTTQYRLGLSGGTPMHWSRFIDLPIANLISFFSLFAGPHQAEALALAVWPSILVVAVLFSAGVASYRLGGTMAMHATLILTGILILSLNRFQPGSIDHHNVQILLVTAITAMLLSPTGRPRDHAIAGVLAGFAIAIGVETTPLIGAVCLIVALRWAWYGSSFRDAATAYGLALALTTTGAFFATVAPSHYTQVTCDSLSYGFYALATLGGGTLFLTASLASTWSFRGRLVALAGAGAVLAAAVLLIAPGCLSNPLDALDPLLKIFWLDMVIEAQSAIAQFRLDPTSIASFYATGLIAIVACLRSVHRREATEQHLILVALLTVAFAISILQVRGSIFVYVLAAIPLGRMVAGLRQASNAAPKNLKLGAAFAGLTLASTPASWALAGALWPGQSGNLLRAELSTRAKPPTCKDQSVLAPLAHEPVGVVAAVSDLGAPILRFTGHRVLSAPYHRNQGGMLTELHIGLSNPHQAEAFLRGAKVTLLAFCPGNSEIAVIADAEPDGLYADLLKGKVPAYLEPVEGAQGPVLQLYRVKPE